MAAGRPAGLDQRHRQGRARAESEAGCGLRGGHRVVGALGGGESGRVLTGTPGAVGLELMSFEHHSNEWTC
jgi:hypothetical protein